jgi:type IV pilus assembly protein PilO
MSTSRPSSVWSERLKSPLTWHIAGFAVLLIITIALGVRLALDWTATNSHSNDVFAGKQVQLKALELQTAPLSGIGERVEQTREKMVSFEKKRIPPNYSSIDARIEELQIASGVRLSRVQYTQGPPGTGLTEISVDTNISGEYAAIMRFVNSIERDQTFFVIRTMSFTGAQGGLVNLRMQLSTWLRPADAAASGLPSTPQAGDQAPAPEAPTVSSVPGKEGE